ncbi:hypothetical protein ACFVXD_45045, partial [Kitasatospora herbaricolor]
LEVLRGAVLVVSGEQQVALDGDNLYADENRAHEWLAFDLARRLDADELETLIRWRLAGVPAGADATAGGGGRLVALDSSAAHLADLSVTSHALDDGAWLHPDAEARVLDAIAAGEGHALTRFGEHRLSRATLDRSAPSATLALSVTLRVPAGATVSAPFAGLLERSGAAWVLHGDAADL